MLGISDATAEQIATPVVAKSTPNEIAEELNKEITAAIAALPMVMAALRAEAKASVSGCCGCYTCLLIILFYYS